MSTTLVFDHLTKRFGATTAVEDLSATVRPGRVTGFLGPNGAGKTTTPAHAARAGPPDRRHGHLRRPAYAELTEPVREVGTLLEATGFHPGRRARDHLRVLAVAARLPARPARTRCSSRSGWPTPPAARSASFSLGMRQRLGLAAALLGDPPVLVLDEPANGLDPQGIRWLRTFLRSLAAEGRTVLVSSHVLPEVEQTADDVLVLARGRLVRQGTLAELGAGVGTGHDGAQPRRGAPGRAAHGRRPARHLVGLRRAARRGAAGARRRAGRRARGRAAPAVGDRRRPRGRLLLSSPGEARA